MRCRGANCFTSTCPARTAVSSSSSSEKRGTCFNTSGLQAIGHLVRSSGSRVIFVGYFIRRYEVAIFSAERLDSVALLTASGSLTHYELGRAGADGGIPETDRKSTRLNSSHEWISY